MPTRRSHTSGSPASTEIPGAKELLADLLTDPERAPTFVARFQDEATCGLEQGILDELYKPFTTVEGVPIWVRNDRT